MYPNKNSFFIWKWLLNLADVRVHIMKTRKLWIAWYHVLPVISPTNTILGCVKLITVASVVASTRAIATYRIIVFAPIKSVLHATPIRICRSFIVLQTTIKNTHTQGKCYTYISERRQLLRLVPRNHRRRRLFDILVLATPPTSLLIVGLCKILC